VKAVKQDEKKNDEKGSIGAAKASMEDTIMFQVKSEDKSHPRQVLQTVYDALTEKGYHPVNQIVGYMLSGDPAYITSHQNARALIRKLDRDDLLEELVRNYLEIEE
jgi:uncharacterized protein (UPF0297 family)